MRGVVVAFCLVAATSAARAQSAPSTYPNEITERPIMLLDGMTELRAVLLLPTYTLTTLQPDGTITSHTSSLGDYVDLLPAVRHSFGLVEITGSFGVHLHHPSDRTYPSDLKYGNVMARAGSDAYGNAQLGFAWFPTTGDGHLDLLFAGYEYKRHVLPHQLALYAATTLNLTDYAFGTTPGVPPADYHSVSVQPDVEAELQISPKLALHVIGGAVVPIEDSAPTADDKLMVYAEAEALLALGTYDLIAAFGINDLTNTRLPSLIAAIQVRL